VLPETAPGDSPPSDPINPDPAVVEAPRDRAAENRDGAKARDRERRASIRPETLEDALKLLESEDADVRQRGLWYLQDHPPEAPNPEVADKVLACLTDDQAIPPSIAVRAVKAWATPEQLPELEKLLDHEDLVVRQEMIETIGGFKSKKAAEAIVDRLSDTGMRYTVSSHLKKIGEDAEDAVLKKLRDPDASIRREVCEILGEIGTSKAVRRLNALQKDPDVSVKFSAETASQKIRARLKY
jgi:HEAT repeat protein